MVNTIAMGIAVQILEQETMYSVGDWTEFLCQRATEMYKGMDLETKAKQLDEWYQMQPKIV